MIKKERRLSRRKLLSTAGVVGSLAPLLARGISEDVLAATPRGGGRSNLAIELQFQDGTSLRFRDDEADDVGDYDGVFVHQKCFRVRGGDAWTIFFRPDINGSRDEIVVERGAMKLPSGTSPTHILKPYTAVVSKGGRQIAKITVPCHWWFARWRWQSAPRSVVRSCRELIGKGLLLPYSKEYLYGARPWTRVIRWAGPMDTAGLETAMGTVGDRPEIGPTTLPQADYILNGSDAALVTMMAQAEAAGTMGFHFRDGSGTWIDFTATGSLSIGYADKTIPMPPNPPLPPGMASGNHLDPRWFTIETSHTPAVSYLPYLLTDDPYLLEELQAMANWGRAVSAYHPAANKLPGLVYPGETRSFAWSIRSMMQAAKITPAAVPSWLRPASYFKALLADNLTYGKRFMASPCKAIQRFHFFSRVDNNEGFEADYTGIILCWVLRMGFSEWTDFVAWWFAGNIIPFVSDNSGWKKGWPDPYGAVPFSKPPGATCLVSDTHLDSLTYSDYAAMFRDYVDHQGYISDKNLAASVAAWDGHSIMQNQSSAGYYVWRAGALHLATMQGIAGAKDAMTWLDSQLPIQLRKFRQTGDQRFSFAAS